MHGTYTFKSKLWLYDGFGGWHFVNLPVDMSAEIKEQFGPIKKRGWGSIPITATVGKTTWDTSIFPDKKGYYLLAIKAAVRKAENIGEDDEITVTIKIR